MQSTPSMRPMPQITPALGALSLPSRSGYSPRAAKGESSRNGVPGSSSICTRSRGSSLPRPVWRARATSPPPKAARVVCALRSSTSARMAAALAWKSLDRALSLVSRMGIALLSGSFVVLQPQLLLHVFTDLELLDLAGHGHRELGHKANVAWHLVVRNLALAERLDVFFAQTLARLGDDPGAQLLAVFLIGDADHLHV